MNTTYLPRTTKRSLLERVDAALCRRNLKHLVSLTETPGGNVIMWADTPRGRDMLGVTDVIGAVRAARKVKRTGYL